MAHLPFIPAVLLSLGVSLAADPPRVAESVLPALASGPSCSSAVDLQNLGDQSVTVEVEAHRGSGALVPLVGHPQIHVQLAAGERVSYKLQLSEQTTSAWVKVRETISAARLRPVIAVAGTVECVSGNQLRASIREAAYPMRNPWFSGEVAEMPGNVLALINTSDTAVLASACYSSGGLFSVPREGRPNPELAPVCSAAFDIQVPPFAAREFPVEREGSSNFSLKTRGAGIVLQMLHPISAGVKVYMVDSTIKFGQEIAPSQP